MREEYESNSVFSVYWNPCAGARRRSSAGGNGQGQTATEGKAAVAISKRSGGASGDSSAAGISDASYSSRAA
jgi:hypothetical protein